MSASQAAKHWHQSAAEMNGSGTFTQLSSAWMSRARTM